jgi:GMP synthase (glutamine-hydrolysing)
MNKSSIAIIDCAMEEPSLYCFNKMVNQYQRSFYYHTPPSMGIKTLKSQNDVAGYIVFGSISNVEDKLEWHLNLAKFLKEEIESNIPVLGICFAHQLMADAYGGKVSKIENKEYGEQGIREINFLSNRFGFKNSLNIFTSHRFEVTELPKDFELIATSSACKYDAIAHKKYPYLSFQGHPEASSYFIENTIKTSLSQEEIIKGSQGGQEILDSFFKLVDSN